MNPDPTAAWLAGTRIVERFESLATLAASGTFSIEDALLTDIAPALRLWAKKYAFVAPQGTVLQATVLLYAVLASSVDYDLDDLKRIENEFGRWIQALDPRATHAVRT